MKNQDVSVVKLANSVENYVLPSLALVGHEEAIENLMLLVKNAFNMHVSSK